MLLAIGIEFSCLKENYANFQRRRYLLTLLGSCTAVMKILFCWYFVKDKAGHTCQLDKFNRNFILTIRCSGINGRHDCVDLVK